MMSPAPSPATTSLYMISAKFAYELRPYKNASHSIKKVSRRRFTKMSPRRAWVREKKPKMTKEAVDPTVALLPMLNYLGCRPNNHAASYRVKEDSPEEEDEFIEIVTPRRQQQQQQQHHHHQHQQQHSSPKYSPHYSQEQPISRQHQQNRHQELRSATARASAAAQSRTATNANSLKSQRLGPHSTGDTRRYAGGGGGGTSRASLHMSRAMAVNLDAMTPLAM